jgi:hypothetical protein
MLDLDQEAFGAYDFTIIEGKIIAPNYFNLVYLDTRQEGHFADWIKRMKVLKKDYTVATGEKNNERLKRWKSGYKNQNPQRVYGLFCEGFYE